MVHKDFLTKRKTVITEEGYVNITLKKVSHPFQTYHVSCKELFR